MILPYMTQAYPTLKSSVRSVFARLQILRAQLIVGVAEEEHGLRVQLVGEEELGEEGLRLGIETGRSAGRYSSGFRCRSRYWKMPRTKQRTLKL